MFTRFNGSGSWLDLIQVRVRVYMHVISVVDGLRHASISILSLLVWISSIVCVHPSCSFNLIFLL